LSAYVFNYGAEQRRQEEARREAYRQKQMQIMEQMQTLQKQLQSEGRDHVEVEIGRVRPGSTRRIEEQCAVLVGGYPDMDSAHRALEQIRNLVPARNIKPADFGDVKLNYMLVIHKDERSGEQAPINPFKAAFVVHNPAAAAERPAEASKLDLAVLRRLNEGESYSLLNSKKPLTLVVAQYLLPSPLEQRGKGGSILGKISTKAGDMDPAAIPAHNLAEWLRKGNIDSYVLHTKNASIVTVGSYDNLQDPRLSAMKERWGNMSKNPQYQMLNLFPQAVPMQVPR
jgi:hypothetical protein